MKNISGYDGLYLVSTNGDIFSKIVGRFLKPEITRLGYYRIGLRKNKKRTRFLVHRLVAETFMKKPLWATEINHLDGKKSNNHVSNLEWSTRSKNIKHAFNNGLCRPLRGSDNFNSKLNEHDVLEIKAALKDPFYGIVRMLGKKYGVTPETISAIRYNRIWAHINV